jgi:maltose alpha-D-glucosyltransferase/alpha-amylase
LGRGRPIRLAEVTEVISFPRTGSFLLFIRVEYTAGDPEVYVLPLAVARGERVEQVLRDVPEFVMARVEGPGGSGVLYSAMRNSDFCEELLTAVARRQRFAGEHGELLGVHTRSFRRLWGADRPSLRPMLPKVEQSNTTIFFGERFTLKLFRRIEAGPQPERELGEIFTEKAPLASVPPLAGYLEYRAGPETTTLAVVHGFVAAEADAWRFTLDNLSLYFEQALARGASENGEKRPLLDLAAEPPQVARELIGSYLEMARILGVRTAEMHVVLGSRSEPDFAPEPFTDFYRMGLYHGMLGRATRVVQELRSRLGTLPEEARGLAQALLDGETQVRARYRLIHDKRIAATRIRYHGALDLQQVLYTGKDFVFLDFEGDAERPISERRIKRSPLWDVASMLVSLYSASQAVLYGEIPAVAARRLLDRQSAVRDRACLAARRQSNWRADPRYSRCTGGSMRPRDAGDRAALGRVRRI